MKRTTLAVLLAGFMLGCSPAPEGPVSDADLTDVEVTLPGDESSSEADANLTRVTLKVPGMT